MLSGVLRKLWPISLTLGSAYDLYTPRCDITFESTVCLKGGEHVILPLSRPVGLIGRYSFDELTPSDSSGYGNHAIGALVPGPGATSRGYSALIRNSILTIPHPSQLVETTMTVTFWLYVLSNETPISNDSDPVWCPIFAKGVLQPKLGAVILSLDPNNGGLKVDTATSASSRAGTMEFFQSNSRLRKNRWYKIAISQQPERVLLYINGILDSTLKFEGIPVANNMPFYIGGFPAPSNGCDTSVLVDDLNIWSTSLGQHFIQADASVALGGIEPWFVTLSCIKCTRLQAEEGCPETHHLCSYDELVAGVYHVADLMGWLSYQMPLWEGDGKGGMVMDLVIQKVSDAGRKTPSASAVSPEGQGVGVCCAD